MTNFLESKIKNFLELLEKYKYRESIDITDLKCKECGYKYDSPIPAVDDTWEDFVPGSKLVCDKDGHFWFHTTIDIPDKGYPPYLTLRTGREKTWDATNPQFTVYVDGETRQGFDTNHHEVLLPHTGLTDIYIYAYCGMEGGEIEFDLKVQYLDELCEKVYYDIKVPYESLLILDKNTKDYADIGYHISKACDFLDVRVPYSKDYDNGLLACSDYLEKEFYKKVCKKGEVSAICIGHTHIDVAWLWPLRQTREKAIRSFSTVIRLMKQYPKYKFMSSQVHLYKVVKEDDPALYEEIKEMVRQGRWEVEGAMWVEADCNLSGGEGLVRQILYGKRFFKEEFGVDSKVLWLPDVFGYSAALPQILQKCGVDKFVTSKISWNETNLMPYDTFNWEGIDGTTIFTYFLTAQDKKPIPQPEPFTTYNANLTPSMTYGAWNRFQQKELTDETILTFGHGDGGGGPTKWMLENALRLEKGIPGLPTVVMDTATNFLNRLKKRTENERNMPKWVGELYLELHRGTYTSNAKNKKNNRKSEFAYMNAELISSIGLKMLGKEYPQKDINDSWEIILVNQFHDILPGSSIGDVYDTCDEDYAKVLSTADKIISTGIDNIAKNVKTDGGYLVYNPNSYDNSDVVDIDGKLVYVENIPANGYKVITPVFKETSVKITDKKLENKYFKVTFNADYTIKQIYDKVNKRNILKGNGNQLRAFDDHPRCYDAWEITDYYTDKVWDIDDVDSVTEVKEGCRGGFKIRRKFLSSIIEQTIYLYDDINRIDFDTFIDWKENHVLVKAAFPFDVHASKATYDIQFGTAERPTHQNTSWDKAKFEVCAHKFADVSENGYGVSLLNDCKYGYSTIGSEMSLTLLKSATYPYPDADKCTHEFTYSIYPHKGSFTEGGTVQAAYTLNNPMTAVKVKKNDGILPDSFSFVKSDAENIIIETVKKAEDSNANIVRMYDAYDMRCDATVTFGFDVKRVTLCDMMENEIKEVKVNNNSVKIPVKPFEIVTLKVE